VAGFEGVSFLYKRGDIMRTFKEIFGDILEDRGKVLKAVENIVEEANNIVEQSNSILDALAHENELLSELQDWSRDLINDFRDSITVGQLMKKEMSDESKATVERALLHAKTCERIESE